MHHCHDPKISLTAMPSSWFFDSLTFIYFDQKLKLFAQSDVLDIYSYLSKNSFRATKSVSK